MSEQFNMFEEHNFQESTESLSEVHVKILALAETVPALTDNVQVLLPKQYGLSTNADHVFLSGKMLKECSAQTVARIFGQSYNRLPTLGVIDLNGNCSIQGGLYPKIANACTLSDILETEVDDKYFLSDKTIKRLMGYKDNTQIQYNHSTENCGKVHTLLKVNSIKKSNK